VDFDSILKILTGNVGWLNAIFGGKPWFQSITGWGVALYFGFSQVVDRVCDPEAMLLSVATCATVSGVMKTVGLVMIPLGIRKASTTPNVPASPL